MQLVTEYTQSQLNYWSDMPNKIIVFTAPEDPPDCIPCPGIVTQDDGYPVVRVAWKPDEIELAHLARGGTIWLSTWGGLPAHQLEVQEP